VRVRGLAWTPDGSAVVVAEQESRSDLVLFDLREFRQMTVQPGHSWEIYELTAPLGAGGMADVYARDTKLYREVAIKVLPEAFTTDPDRGAVVLAPSCRRSGGGALARVHVEWSFRLLGFQSGGQRPRGVRRNRRTTITATSAPITDRGSGPIRESAGTTTPTQSPLS
jgi:hypothetical protein